MPKDHLGNELEVGDRVVFFQTGRYSFIRTTEIIAIKTKIKVSYPDREFSGRLYTTWFYPESCVLLH